MEIARILIDWIGYNCLIITFFLLGSVFLTIPLIILKNVLRRHNPNYHITVPIGNINHDVKERKDRELERAVPFSPEELTPLPSELICPIYEFDREGKLRYPYKDW